MDDYFVAFLKTQNVNNENCWQRAEHKIKTMTEKKAPLKRWKREQKLSV